jgi:hypothetical protein
MQIDKTAERTLRIASLCVLIARCIYTPEENRVRGGELTLVKEYVVGPK